MRPAFGGAGTPAMRLLPRRLRLLRRLLLASGGSVVALMPWQLGSLPRISGNLPEISSKLGKVGKVGKVGKMLA